MVPPGPDGGTSVGDQPGHRLLCRLGVRDYRLDNVRADRVPAVRGQLLDPVELLAQDRGQPVLELAKILHQALQLGEERSKCRRPEMLEHLLGPLEMASDAGRHRLQVANTLVGPTLQRLVAFFAQNRLAGLDSGGGDGLGHATRGGHDLRLVAVPATLLARGESVVDARLEVARQLSNTTWNRAQGR